MAVYSIDILRTLFSLIGGHALVTPLSEQEQFELTVERAREDRIRERNEDDTRRADQLAADLRDLDEIIERDLQDNNAERGAFFDIVV